MYISPTATEIKIAIHDSNAMVINQYNEYLKFDGKTIHWNQWNELSKKLGNYSVGVNKFRHGKAQIFFETVIPYEDRERTYNQETGKYEYQITEKYGKTINLSIWKIYDR